jgi:PAS domain S-box-containing protein
LRHAGPAILTGALYCAVAAASLFNTRSGGPVAPIWLADAILLGAVLRAPAQARWIYLLAGLAGHVAANLIFGERLSAVIVFAVANLGGVLIADLCLRGLAGEASLRGLKEALRFLAICGLIAPAASAVIAATDLIPYGASLADLAMWYAAIALGFILFTPAIVLLDRPALRSLVARGRTPRGGAIVAAVLAVVAGLLLAPNAPVPLLILPAMALVAFEFGLAGVATGLALFAVVLVSGSILHQNMSLAPFSLQTELLLFQAYLAAASTTVFPLAAALDQRRRLTESLELALAEMREAWGEVLASEARYRLLADYVNEIVLLSDQRGMILFASPSAQKLGYMSGALENRLIWDFLHSDDQERARNAMAILQNPARASERRPNRYRIRLADGAWHWVEATSSMAPSVEGGDGEIVIVLRDIPSSGGSNAVAPTPVNDGRAV